MADRRECGCIFYQFSRNIWTYLAIRCERIKRNVYIQKEVCWEKTWYTENGPENSLNWGKGAVDQRLRALAVIAENSSSYPSTDIR